MRFFKEITIVATLFFSFLLSTFGQNSTSSDSLFKLILNSDTRTLYKLSGSWETSIDGGEPKSEYFPKVFYNCETVKIRKIIHLDKQLIANSVWHLYFLGVNDEVELYWNNQFLGKFVSDGSPLWVTLPRKATIKEHNEVEIVMSSSNSLAYKTRRNYPFYRKIVTGIPRDFYLVRTPTAWINYIAVNPEFESLGKGNLRLKVNISSFEVENLLRVQNPTQIFPRRNFSLEMILRDRVTKQVVGRSEIGSFELASFRNIVLEASIGILNPNLWEPENPNLYEVEVRLSALGTLVDNLVQEVGFTKWDNYKLKEGFGFILNGKPFLLKAIDIVEDYEYYYSGETIKKIEGDLRNLKSMGANAVRFLFTPPHPLFLALANRYGILVLIDLPVYNIPSNLLKKSDLFIRFLTVMENIAKNCGTNPSLFAFGLGEGLNFAQPETQDYIQRISSRISHYLRIKKFVTFVIGQEPKQLNLIDFYVVKDNFRIKENEIVLSELRKMNSILQNPVIFNFGVIIDPTNHKGYNDPMSVEYQAFFLNNRYNIRNQVGNAGVLFWCYNDYFTENPQIMTSKNEPFVCYSGIVNYKSQRTAFNMLKALFNNEETPIVNPGQPESDYPVLYILSGVLAFLLWGVMINRSRRFREHTFRSLFRTYNFFADIRDRRLISNWQTGIFGLVISIIIATYLSSVVYYYKTSNLFNLLMNFFIPNVFFREWLFRLSWQPEIFVTVFSLLIFVKLLLIAILLKFASFFVRSKIFLSDTFKMVIWAGAPILFMLPIAIFLNRILPISPLLGYLFNAIFILLILLWLLRLIKSVWVVFDVRPSVVYLISSILVIISFLAYFSILEYKYYIVEYLSHYSQIGVL
ncbi:hypothetical protein D9V84_02215 [Bacteroidetes/Chlorobi group bacterium Naka2016]|jgi:beta-galactosidase|nr:MAG: hypothetical protein D9V84_02215 [Bacteroidetes/Chlorobi group bacterium Naka2016]